MSRVSDERLKEKADGDFIAQVTARSMARELRALRGVAEAARAKRANPDSVQEEHAFDKALAAYDALEDGR